MGRPGGDSPRCDGTPPSQMEGERIPAVLHDRSHVLALRATSGDREGSEVLRRARKRDKRLFLEEVKGPGDHEAMYRRPDVSVREVGDRPASARNSGAAQR